MPTTQVLDPPPPVPVITAPAPVIHDTRAPVSTTGKTTLWDRIAIAVRARGYSLSTERTYLHWAKAYTAWHGRRHVGVMAGGKRVHRILPPGAWQGPRAVRWPG